MLAGDSQCTSKSVQGEKRNAVDTILHDPGSHEGAHIFLTAASESVRNEESCLEKNAACSGYFAPQHAISLPLQHSKKATPDIFTSHICGTEAFEYTPTIGRSEDQSMRQSACDHAHTSSFHAIYTNTQIYP
jgi:hypothetical protein